MAQHGIRATAEHGGHPNAPLIDAPPADREDASKDRMQALRPEARSDRSPPQPERDELIPSDHAMLPIGKLGNRRIRANRQSCIYVMLICRLAAHGPHRCCRSATRG
jgi:hypothetical protein